MTARSHSLGAEWTHVQPVHSRKQESIIITEKYFFSSSGVFGKQFCKNICVTQVCPPDTVSNIWTCLSNASCIVSCFPKQSSTYPRLLVRRGLERHSCAWCDSHTPAVAVHTGLRQPFCLNEMSNPRVYASESNGTWINFCQSEGWHAIAPLDFWRPSSAGCSASLCNFCASCFLRYMLRGSRHCQSDWPWVR